MQEPIAVPVCR